MRFALDVGHGLVKRQVGGNPQSFLSLYGRANPARVHAGESRYPDYILRKNESSDWMAVGDAAAEASRFPSRMNARSWIESDGYYHLFLGSLHDISGRDLEIVTGLPVDYYSDKDTLREVLLGRHTVQFIGEEQQEFNVRKVVVIEQPMGCLIDAALDDRGQILDANVAEKKVGILDVGSGTTDIFTAKNLREIRPDVTGVRVGCQDMIKEAKTVLEREFPDRELESYEIAQLASGYSLMYKGEEVDVRSFIKEAARPFADQIVDEATGVWQTGTSLYRLIITGGGAFWIEDAMRKVFDNVTVASDPIHANVNGYWKLAMSQS